MQQQTAGELAVVAAFFAVTLWLIAQPTTHWHPTMKTRRDRNTFRVFTAVLFAAAAAIIVIVPAGLALPLLLLALFVAVSLPVRAFIAHRRLRKLTRRFDASTTTRTPTHTPTDEDMR